jgi:hypothetical protein
LQNEIKEKTMLHVKRKCRQNAILVFICGLYVVYLCSCIKRPESYPQISTVSPPEITKLQQEGTTKASLKFPVPQKKFSKRGAPLTDFTTSIFLGSHHCSKCHDDLTDDAGNDVSISVNWRSTMMANSAKDPFWQAKVKSEVQRNPALAKEIEKKCIRCHMPMAWIQASAQKKQYKLVGVNSLLDELLDPNFKLHEAAMDGVSCSLCHQIKDENLGTADSFSGQYVIDTSILPPNRPIYGPYRDIYQETMINTIGYSPMYGPQMNDSALCATCHTLYTPYVDAKGNVLGEFPQQTVYLEWLHSDYGEKTSERHELGVVKGKVKLCQDCHMPLSDSGAVIIAQPAHKEVTAKDHFSRHHFVGGNVFMVNMMHDQIIPTQVSATTSELKNSAKLSLEQLQMNSARLFIEEASIYRDQLRIEIRIDNRIGHKFPTGFPSRRAWIHLTVTDAAGQIIFESGSPQIDGSILGDNSNENGGFEPHYDEITQPGQVQIYESVMVTTEQDVTYTLMRGSGYIKDNRLLPYGFNNRTAPADIKVRGHAEQDSDFKGGSDKITYRIPVSENAGPIEVRAELLYTPISYAFLKDLRKEDHLPLVKRFRQFYGKADKTPVAVSAAETQVR